MRKSNWKKIPRDWGENKKIFEKGICLVSMVVVFGSRTRWGSRKRWDRWHIIPQLAGKMPLIYHLYIAFWRVICYLQPFTGTRNNH